MGWLDVGLYLNALCMLYLGLSHISGGMGSFEALGGYDVASFMPAVKKNKRAPVPEELSRLLEHAAAALGAAQCALAIMCLLASFSEWPRAKKLAIRSMSAYFFIMCLMETSYPAGTGTGGSPAAGLYPEQLHGLYPAATLLAVSIGVTFLD